MAYRIFTYGRAVISPFSAADSAALVSRSVVRMVSYNVKSPQDFEEKVIKSKQPVIVDFFASWCRPCKDLAPRLEKVMSSYDGKVDFAKVDVDEMQDLAMEYGVMSVPTVVAMKNGKPIDKFVGAKNTEEIQTFVQSVLKK